MQVKDRIAQHKHCRECGRAFSGEGKYCSEECSRANKQVMQKKKRQLMLLYIASFVVLILAILMMGFS